MVNVKGSGNAQQSSLPGSLWGQRSGGELYEHACSTSSDWTKYMLKENRKSEKRIIWSKIKINNELDIMSGQKKKQNKG